MLYYEQRTFHNIEHRNLKLGHVRLGFRSRFIVHFQRSIRSGVLAEIRSVSEHLLKANLPFSGTDYETVPNLHVFDQISATKSNPFFR